MLSRHFLKVASTGISQKFKYFPNSKLNHSIIQNAFCPKVYNNCLIIQIWVIGERVLLASLKWVLEVRTAEGTDDANFTYTILQVHCTLIGNIFASVAKQYTEHVFEFARHGACGQFSERCDVDGSFFNSDAIPIIFLKSLTSPSSRLFSLTIGNDYFSIILLILGPIILRLFTITNNHTKPPVSTP